MRLRRAAGLVLAAFLAAAPARGAEVLTYTPDHPVRDLGRIEGPGRGISLPSGRIAVRLSDSRSAEAVPVLLPLAVRTGRLAPASVDLPQAAVCPPVPVPHRRAALPDFEATRGEGAVCQAWLGGPTDRYRHGVLGDRIEATTLNFMTGDGAVHSFELPDDSVFEDRRLRLYDLDGDGRDEAIVVRAYPDAGAALAVYSFDGEAIRPLAETPAIGTPNRWLNPAGAGDFDGDGRVEIAYVETPHIGGTLRLVELRAGTLAADGSARGFSNHAIGSRELGMAAVMDWNGDGVPDLLLPDSRREALRVVTFAGGAFRELDRVEHQSAIVSGIVTTRETGTPRLWAVYTLAGGTVVAVAADGRQ